MRRRMGWFAAAGAVATAAPVGLYPLPAEAHGAGAPTGQAFNDTMSFTGPGTGKPALFMFAGENGDLSVWNQMAGTSAVNVGHSPKAVYKGLALDHSPFGPLLLATNFHDDRIDVFDAGFNRLPADKLFRDPFLPRGYAPFNVAEISKQIFVTYAKPDADRHDDVAGPRHGFVDVYTNHGVLEHWFASRGALNSPWGPVIAPASCGDFAGDLLIANFGDGRIHAFNPHSGRLVGTLSTANHKPIVIDGLWGLIVGDQVAGGIDSVWFSAGPDEESHGLLGLLHAG